MSSRFLLRDGHDSISGELRGHLGLKFTGVRVWGSSKLGFKIHWGPNLKFHEAAVARQWAVEAMVRRGRCRMQAWWPVLGEVSRRGKDDTGGELGFSAGGPPEKRKIGGEGREGGLAIRFALI